MVQNIERVLLGLTDCKYGGQRVERGVFNVLCEASKIRFVTIDCDDAHCYSEQIERFEQNSDSMTDRLKEQLRVVKLCYGQLTALFVMWTVVELKWRKDCYRLKCEYKYCLEKAVSKHECVTNILPMKIGI